MKKVFIESYGCAANTADAEIMAGLLKEAGFKITNSFKDSDLNILNTCVVKNPTEQRMVSRIKELSRLKKPLVVTGCMPKTGKKTIERINPNASMIGPDSIQRISEVVDNCLKEKRIFCLEDVKEPKVCLPKLRKNPVIDIIPISTGCLGSCSYCEVKFARGSLFSYPAEKIKEEAETAIMNSCKELLITSQDNSCYGKDIGSNLPQLLKKICQIDGKFFVRVGMMNPLHAKEILDELIEVYRNEKIFKFLHLPVQSASDRILKLMDRGYTVKDFLKIVEKFKKEFPDLLLATDIIVGFPTETEEEFQETVELIERIRPDMVNISKFGSRPNTSAAKMKQLEEKTLNERTKTLHKMAKKILLENNRKLIGWEGEVLVDEKIKNGFIGRDPFYRPFVIRSNKNILGKFVKVKATDAVYNCLIADI